MSDIAMLTQDCGELWTNRFACYFDDESKLFITFPGSFGKVTNMLSPLSGV